MENATSAPTAWAAAFTVASISANRARALPSSKLRTSPVTQHCSGTTLSALPPVMVPTFTVVSPTRPHGMDTIAWAAAWMAWMPSSGEKAA